MPSPIASHALLTGANRGLGLEWTRQLAGRVDRLFATCRRPAEADRLRSVAEAYPETIEVFALDVTDPDAIAAAADRVNGTTGVLDLLLNNAGINGDASGDRFGEVDQDTMTDVFRVNAAGPHLMTQAFADLLREGARQEGQATVLNVTSQLGSIANTRGGGWHSYKASKAALNMCTRLQAGALEGDNVVVVSMHPGWVRTDMGGSNARLSPEEAVTGMLEVLAGLTLEDTCRFLAYDGRELPW